MTSAFQTLVGPLGEMFSRQREMGTAALIGYLPAGFPSVPVAIDVMKAMVDGGVDAIEVGLPYSDPLLDGPTIQQAVEQALASGVDTPAVFETVRQVAETGVPTMVMSYWNPIERFGVDRFADELAEAGGAGVITADITPEEAGEWVAASDRVGLARIFLVAPSSTPARVQLTTAATTGFVYAAAVMGVTGARTQVGSAAQALVERTRSVTTLPICVGLGVSTGRQAAEIAGYADGVIVGSAFVRAVLDAGSATEAVDAVRSLASELKAGIEQAGPAA